jgi:hypothetical protein
MELLDEHWPADIFTGESGDPGPRIVALVRMVDNQQRQIERLRALIEDDNRSLIIGLYDEAVAQRDQARADLARLRAEMERVAPFAEEAWKLSERLRVRIYDIRARAAAATSSGDEELCDAPTKGYYGDDSPCAKPKGHDGDHHATWRPDPAPASAPDGTEGP